MSAVQQQTTLSGRSPSGRRLVEHLNDLVTRQDLGALALLRRSLGRPPGEVPEIFAHVLPYLSPVESERAAQREEDAALLVASLYALWHQGKGAPRSSTNSSLGAAFRQLKSQSDSGSIEHRFVELLKASRDRLPDQLRHAISLLKANEIALDWERLFSDLCAWDETDRRARHPVRRRWSRDYWERTREPSETDAGSGEDSGGGDDEG